MRDKVLEKLKLYRDDFEVYARDNLKIRNKNKEIKFIHLIKFPPFILNSLLRHL